MFTKIGKVALLLMLTVGSLSAMDWSSFVDVIDREPGKCFESYNKDLSIEFSTLKNGVPSCKNYSSEIQVATIKFYLDKIFTPDDKVTGYKFFDVASKMGIKRSNCKAFPGEGVICRSHYKGYSVFWKLLMNKNYFLLEFDKTEM